MTISASLTLATVIVLASAHESPGFAFRDRVIQASSGSPLVGILCLAAVGAVAVATRLEGRRTITRRVLGFTMVVASIALLLAVASTWSFLSIHLSSVGDYSHQGVSVASASQLDYSINYRVTGLLRELSSIALLAPTVWVAWQSIRGHKEVAPEDDDTTHIHE